MYALGDIGVRLIDVSKPLIELDGLESLILIRNL